MMRHETWLYNTRGFICFTPWIYDRSVKGFCLEAKARCLEESKVGLKLYKYSYIGIPKNDTYNKRTKKTLIVIHNSLFILFTFGHHNFKNNNLDTQYILIL